MAHPGLLALPRMLLAGPALAEPTEPRPGDTALMKWFQSLMIQGGITACFNVADCRNTTIEWRADGQPYTWIGRDAFGKDAPDSWLPIQV